jgi:hypothetical protein
MVYVRAEFTEKQQVVVFRLPNPGESSAVLRSLRWAVAYYSRSYLTGNLTGKAYQASTTGLNIPSMLQPR